MEEGDKPIALVKHFHHVLLADVPEVAANGPFMGSSGVAEMSVLMPGELREGFQRLEGQQIGIVSHHLPGHLSPV